MANKMPEAALQAFIKEWGLDQEYPVPAPPQPLLTTSNPTTTLSPLSTPTSPRLVGSLDDYLILHDIYCIDADDKVFEDYPTLHVCKDIFREDSSKPKNFTLYQAIVHCEQNGLFLPSFALTCNLVAALYHKAVRKEADGTYTTLDEDAKKVLNRYKDTGNGRAEHVQNTLVDYDTQEVIHYPSAKDFREIKAVNTRHLRVAGSFVKATFSDSCILEFALKNSSYTRYVRQLTGLVDPSILVEIGEYFSGQTAKLYFPWHGGTSHLFKGTTTAWFGYDGSRLNLNSTIVLLSSGGVSRGVRENE